MSGAEDNYRVSSDRPFLLVLAVLGGGYLFLIAAMVVADLIFLDYRDLPSCFLGLKLSKLAAIPEMLLE